MGIFENKKREFIEHNLKLGYRKGLIVFVWYISIPLELLGWLIFRDWNKPK